jgi:hypothetical protein
LPLADRDSSCHAARKYGRFHHRADREAAQRRNNRVRDESILDVEVIRRYEKAYKRTELEAMGGA